MKKCLAIILCIVAVFTCAQAEYQYDVPLAFNSEITEYNSVVHNSTYYLPMRKTFEKFGAYVFYRHRDAQILALLPDGNMISHIVGTNVVSVNGAQKVLENPSFMENYETYIPVEMLSAAFSANLISYEGHQLNIKTPAFAQNETVNDVLNLCKNANFYPEKFRRYINYHAKKPNSTMQDVIFMVNLGFDYSFYENVAVIVKPYELSVLVNKYNQLPSGFAQQNLVNMNPSYTIRDGKQYLLHSTAYEKYVQMAEAAKKEGRSLKVVSAYRTEDFQRRLYNKNLRASGKINADRYSARPGFSEHQTGLAVDINSTSGYFEYTAEFKWMQAHAHEYGFILRYPKGKEWITGYAYEPWHCRYVGVDAATIIHNEGITYEQYYAKYVGVNEFK